MATTTSSIVFKLEGDAATTFDRQALQEFNQDIGGVLEIEDTCDVIKIILPAGMDEVDMDNSSHWLTTLGFE